MNKIDVLAQINPQMKSILDKENELSGDTTDTSMGFELMRKNYIEGRKFWTQGGPLMAKTQDTVIEGPYGAIPLRFYYPTEKAYSAKVDQKSEMPALVYVHGGGFCLGNIETHDRICRVLSNFSDSVVVSVDYRLAPEAKFPVQVEEVSYVISYIHEHDYEYGVDGQRMGMAGDSGGAHLNLAATLYLRAKQKDTSYIKCLLLYYGWYGLRDSSSMRLFGGPWDGLTEEDWNYYLELYTNDLREVETSPFINLFLNDLSHGMPACYIAAAEFDPLIDDSKTLAAICKQYHIPYKFEIFMGTIHAFLHYTRVLNEANEALKHGATFFKQQLGIPENELK